MIVCKIADSLNWTSSLYHGLRSPGHHPSRPLTGGQGRLACGCQSLLLFGLISYPNVCILGLDVYPSDQRTARTAPRHARPVDPAYVDLWIPARSRDRTRSPADFGGRIASGTRRTVSRAPAAGGARLDFCQVGNLFKYPKSPLLLADRGRPQTTCKGDCQVEACGSSHRADTRPRKGGLVQCSDGSGRQATLAPKLKHTYSRRARACENRGWVKRKPGL